MPRVREHLSLKSKLRYVGQTDTGRVRDHSEDSMAFDDDIGLLLLADGMGGYNPGEIASALAVKTIARLVRDALEREDLRIHDSTAGLTPLCQCEMRHLPGAI